MSTNQTIRQMIVDDKTVKFQLDLLGRLPADIISAQTRLDEATARVVAFKSEKEAQEAVDNVMADIVFEVDEELVPLPPPSQEETDAIVKGNVRHKQAIPKKLYTNKESREAAVRKRCQTDQVYIDAMNYLSKVRSSLAALQAEVQSASHLVELHKNRFRASRHACEVIAGLSTENAQAADLAAWSKMRNLFTEFFGGNHGEDKNQ